MTVARVFVPSTVPLLAAAVEAGGLVPPLVAHSARPLREHHPGLDEEELEYAAMQAAALESLRLLGPDDPPVRVVVAVDAVPACVSASASASPDQAPPGAVTVSEPVPMRRWASVHVDTSDASSDVAAARAALAWGSFDAGALAERCLDHDLAWYAVQEVPHLLETLG